MMITLPYPPTVNTYYRHLKNGRTLISERGREYRQEVIATVGKVKPMTGMLEVSIVLYPPDRRRRDIDNTMKALLDSLTHAGLWVDDSQIKRLTIEMMQDVSGNAVVHVRPWRGLGLPLKTAATHQSGIV